MLTDNQFFRQDDGTFLAIHIPFTQGRYLLRLLCGLTAQIGTPTRQTTPPFDLNTVYEDLSSDAQTPTPKDNKATVPASSAPTTEAPAKAFTESSLGPSTGISSTGARMGAVFSQQTESLTIETGSESTMSTVASSKGLLASIN